jgi:hypothetical protein
LSIYPPHERYATYQVVFVRLHEEFYLGRPLLVTIGRREGRMPEAAEIWQE